MNAKSDPKTILFLCTGNYYRSRFAEVMFNSVAAKMSLPWKATSRGLALERGIYNIGPMARLPLRCWNCKEFAAALANEIPCSSSIGRF